MTLNDTLFEDLLYSLNDSEGTEGRKKKELKFVDTHLAKEW